MTPYYSDGAVTIYHGSCLDALPELEPVDHVITDPPYSEHTHSKQRSGHSLTSGHGSPRKIIDRPRDLGFAAMDAATRGFVCGDIARLAARWVVVFSDDESTHLWRADLTGCGLDYVRTGHWVKLGCTPQFSGDRPAQGAEALTICHRPGRKRWNGGGSHAVWTFPIVKHIGGVGRYHTTQKPEALMSELVTLFTDPGETILDPFMGSGTTLVAAKRLGRKAIGIELEEKYCAIAAERLRQGALDLHSSCEINGRIGNASMDSSQSTFLAEGSER